MTLIDHRPGMLSPERWSRVDCMLIRSPDDLIAAVRKVECDAAVIMNHHYERDRDFLTAWLGSEVPYIGMVGPRRRTTEMLATLASGAVPLDRVERRIHAPVGLDLGGETAEEIALSIVAEIRASVAGRSGGPLRNRHTPIHARQKASVELGTSSRQTSNVRAG